MQKQILSVTSICIVIICAFQLSSCIKVADPFNPGDASNIYGDCRIKQIFANYKYGDSRTRVFSYNSNNDPVSIIGGTGGTGDPNPAFKYDSHHRLVEFVGLYGNGYYEYLHHYTYNQNRIVIDSQWVFGLYGGALPSNALTYRFIKYDRLDRIIQDSLILPGAHQSVVVTNYEYDHNGNLVFYKYDQNGNLVNANIVYDSKLSPRRTNKVWMFIDRNYSVNNPVGATAYNSSALPLNINLSETFLGSYYDGSPAAISYSCR